VDVILMLQALCIKMHYNLPFSDQKLKCRGPVLLRTPCIPWSTANPKMTLWVHQAKILAEPLKALCGNSHCISKSLVQLKHVKCTKYQ